MTTLISSQALSLENNHSTLFNQLNLSIQSGEKIALIGHNGSGKSTLLSVLAQAQSEYRGRLHYAQDCRLQWVQQHLPKALQGLNVHQALSSQLPQASTESWRVDALLEQLALSDQAEQLVAELSGGQHTRLMLGMALIHEPNLLLLDEPGNHLDLPSLLWLQNFLQQWRGALLLVSHDLRLLDAVCQHSWILRDQTVYDYQLTASAALAELAQADAAAKLRLADEQKEIQRLQASSHRLAVWGREHDNEALVRKAKSMQKRIVKLEQQQSFVSAGSPWHLQLRGSALAADYILQLEHFSVSAAPGLPALYQLDHLSLRSRDKLALLGANGIGKSSLLRQCWQIWQQAQEDGAQLDYYRNPTCRIHPGARVAYYDQTLQRLPAQASLSAALYWLAPLPESILRQALIHAGFPYLRHSQTVATLSGGEKARLMLLGFSLGEYHLLLLDEPTNHLDLAGKRELAQAIRDYQGAVMLVSHDREFISLSCQRFVVISTSGASEWQAAEAAFEAIATTVETATASKVAQAPEPDLLRPTGPSVVSEQVSASEALLAQWYELDALLQSDLARKPRHQKPALQAQWRLQMAQLEQQLSALESA